MALPQVDSSATQHARVDSNCFYTLSHQTNHSFDRDNSIDSHSTGLIECTSESHSTTATFSAFNHAQ